jgi:hypothetical protein
VELDLLDGGQGEGRLASLLGGNSQLDDGVLGGAADLVVELAQERAVKVALDAQLACGGVGG